MGICQRRYAENGVLSMVDGDNVTLVLANGCFDLLHIGHIRHLQEAKSLGSYLVVGVTMDEYVKKGAGRPVESLDERMEKVRALHMVTAVTACRNSLEALKQWKPDVFVKGSDYAKKGLLKEELAYCKANRIRIAFTRAPKFSTSELIERIKKCA